MVFKMRFMIEGRSVASRVNRRAAARCAGLALAAGFVLWLCGGLVGAQQPATPRAAAPAKLAAPAAGAKASPARPAPAKAAPEKAGYRKLAPGVEVTIPPDKDESETFSQHNVVEILEGIPNLDWKPKFTPGSRTLKEMATGVTFRSVSWCLEFTFKPPRVIMVDEPQPGGKMQRKPIWYMVYHVKNTGKHIGYDPQPDGTYAPKNEDIEMRFLPLFILEAIEFDAAKKKKRISKAYLDRLIPVAWEPIQQKEDPNRKLLNSVTIGGRPIPLSTDREDNSVWGVATWEDLDPKIDFFSISIQGLSNAFKWVDPPGGYQAGGPPGTGRVMTQKTLVLNFWRPGDEYLEQERPVHFGISGEVDYEWVYR